MLKIKLFLVLLVFPVFMSLKAQDISGIWEGTTGPSQYVMPVKTILEISVYNDSMITGVVHAYYTRGRFEHHRLSGRISKKNSMVYLKEESIISYKVGFLQTIYAGTYTLKLSQTGSELLLAGKWTSGQKLFLVNPNVNKWFRKEIASNPPLPVLVSDSNRTIPTMPLNKIIPREEVQMVIELDKKNKDSVQVELYDNGEIDNDTISVYLNDSKVVDRQMISTTPITFYMSLSEDKHFDKIRLVAENLGTMPPNTALMVITTRKNKYKIFLNSSYETSAVVEFFLKEK